MLVRHLTDGQDVDAILLVRERELRTRHDGSAFLRLCSATGRAPCRGACRAAATAAKTPTAAECPRLRGRRARARAGALRGPPALRPADRRRRAARRAPGRRRLVRAARRPAARRRPDGGRPARSSWPRSRTATCASCWTRCSGPESATWAAFRDAPAAKRYHQAYRHGLLEHCARRRPGGLRDLGHLPGHRPRRRGQRRAAARHRQAGRLHGRPARHRDDGRGQAPGRDRARLLPRAPADRGPAGLPGRPRRRRAPHHPQPPRPARARLARGPVHARGDARAHDRQPRRPARLVRPAGEGAGGRQPLVGLRPRAGRRRVLRGRAAA